MTLASDDPRHGTLTAYSYHKCRCEVCYAAIRADRAGKTAMYNAASQRYRERKAAAEGRVLGQAFWKSPDWTWHGTIGGYSNHKCRCDACSKAFSEYQREAGKRRKNAPTPEHIHGTYNGYTNYGCRCTACRLAQSRRGGHTPRPRPAPKLRIYTAIRAEKLPAVLRRQLVREIAMLPRFTREG